MTRSTAVGALLLLLGTAAACGPKHATPPSGDDRAGGGSAAGHAIGGGTNDGGASGGGAVVAAPLTRAECEQMIDHVLEIGMAAQRAQKSADFVPTAAQVAEIRAGLVAEQLDACLAWPRPQWTCVLGAKTVDALYACADDSPAP